MAIELRETIRKITQDHLKNGNLLFGQCLSAVGWVNGTVPQLTEEDGLVELSMADVMAGGVVVGAALMGRRPIYVVRYQGFQWFNAPIIINYAGKSKEMWNKPCPIFIRSIAMEGNIGPVASSSHHGIYYRAPGVKIASPMTSNEYRAVYDDFMKGDDSIYVSEHRNSHSNTSEFDNIIYDKPDIVLFPYSVTRFDCEEASNFLRTKGIKVSVFHQVWIKPEKFSHESLENLSQSKYGGVVLDDDFINGIAKQKAYHLMLETSVPVRAFGLEDKVAGFHEKNDNLPPKSKDIVSFISRILDKNAR
jgi:acetoin:2,6-dichlorophenolindophenol oxidoreductase subunit beta